MKALIETETWAVLAVVHSIDGIDMSGKELADLPEGYDPITSSHVFSDAGWVPNAAAAWSRLRAERNVRIEQSDKYMFPHRPMSEETRSQWAAYMQALRDLPENTLDPFNPEWPIAPE